jgi:hypothetical protein
LGQRPNQGHSPFDNSEFAARQASASHQAASRYETRVSSLLFQFEKICVAGDCPPGSEFRISNCEFRI